MALLGEEMQRRKTHGLGQSPHSTTTGATEREAHETAESGLAGQ
jgi:hypothetical protein